MKHIFYVHSYVTYLVVLGVVEHERISDDDVFLITARGAVNQTRFASMDINEKYPSLFGVPCYGKNLFYIKHYRSIKAFDKEIRDICCNYTYICYIPSDSHFFQQLLSSHSKCVKINFLEEGLFSYNDEFRKKKWPFNGLKGIIKRYLYTGNRNHNPLSIVSSATLYTLFSTDNYKGPLNKKCVMPNLQEIKYDGIKLRNTNVLMMNAFKDASSIVISNLLSVIEHFAKDKKAKNEKVYIRHHPYSNNIFREEVESIFIRHGVEHEVLSNRLNTELMLFNSENLSIYGFFSAAMLYGALMGHTAISFVDLFKSTSKECEDYLINKFHIPSIFLSNSQNYY